MTERLDIRIDVSASSPDALAETLGEVCAGTTLWSRDGILEQQVSTNEPVQYCFRNEPVGERPRSCICIAGPPDILTVAAIVPIDRGVELDDEEYNAILEDFYTQMLEPVLERIGADAEIVAEHA